ncbi:MAG TPA: HdeD family acid-resistance protein [Stellaceae bacterium]|nr:HdeD family acid-resistance protein [Stellaceae bacterium]
MLESLMRNWWALALRGAAALLFGILAFVWPHITLTVLIWIFAAYMLADGVFGLIAGLRAAQRQERWWPLAIEGLLDLAVGVIAFLWPNIALLTFIYIAAFWAILSGVALLAAAFRLRAMGEGFLTFAGLLSLLWGIVVIFWPIAGALALAWWIGAYAILFGLFMLTVALRLRRRYLGDRA